MRFLDEQIRQYEEVLESRREPAQGIQAEVPRVSGSRNADFFSRLEALDEEIAAARLQLQIAEQQRDAYQKELAGEKPTLIGATPDAPRRSKRFPSVDARLASLRRALDEQRRKFTDAHPDVQGTQRIIARAGKGTAGRARCAQDRRCGGSGRPATRQTGGRREQSGVPEPAHFACRVGGRVASRPREACRPREAVRKTEVAGPTGAARSRTSSSSSTAITTSRRRPTSRCCRAGRRPRWESASRTAPAPSSVSSILLACRRHRSPRIA